MSFISRLQDKVELLRSGRVLVVALVLGAFWGFYFPEGVASVKFITEAYLDTLKVLVIPLILTAIFLNIQIIFKDRFFSKISLRFIVILLGISCAASFMGIAGAFLFQPGTNISLQSLGKIDKIVGADFVDQVSRLDLFSVQSVTPQPLLDRLVEAIVPSNIFLALAKGEIIKVAFFAIMFGFAIASVPTRLTDAFNQSLQSVLAACHKLSAVLHYLVPLIAFIVAATLFSKLGSDAIAVMSRFVLAFLLSLLVIFVASVWVLKNRSQASYKEVVSALQPSLAVSITTAQLSTACITQMVQTLSDRLGFSRERVELLVPLAATFVLSAPILFFSLSAVFIAQIYTHDLSLLEVAMIFASAIGQGFASVGLRGQQKLVLLAVICNPLGLPTEAVLMLLLAIEPLCEMLGSLVMVVSQCAAVALICNKPVRL